MQETQTNENQLNEESLIEVDKDFHNNQNKEAPKNTKMPKYFEKIQDAIKNMNLPHHIKIDTIFDTVKDAHTIFAIERKTYDFVINLNKLLIGIIVILVILIISLFPLKEKEPYLVGFSNATQNFVHIEKANETITANEALLRNLIGSYIINRESINHFDDEERYEIVRTQSSPKVWKTFENIVAQEASIYGNSNITREIKVINIAKWKQGYANAEISVSLYALGVLQSQKRYRITLTYKFNTLDIDFESLPKNPTGFEIQEYAVTEIAVIKDLDDENKVDPRSQKSKIKYNNNKNTSLDSNDFLRDAYEFKEKKEKERIEESKKQAEQKKEQRTKYQNENLTHTEKQKILSEELKELKQKQKEEESKNNQQELEKARVSNNPFAD